MLWPTAWAGCWVQDSFPTTASSSCPRVATRAVPRCVIVPVKPVREQRRAAASPCPLLRASCPGPLGLASSLPRTLLQVLFPFHSRPARLLHSQRRSCEFHTLPQTSELQVLQGCCKVCYCPRRPGANSEEELLHLGSALPSSCPPAQVPGTKERGALIVGCPRPPCATGLPAPRVSHGGVCTRPLLSLSRSCSRDRLQHLHPAQKTGGCEPDRHPGPGCRDGGRAPSLAGCDDRRHHLRPEPPEATGHLLHQSAPDQPLRQGSPGLLRQGTLTEDGFDVWGVVPRENCGFLPLIHELHRLPGGPLLSCLATCHTVSVLKGQLVGDPADLKMLESTGWTQEEVEGAEAEAQVAHTFGTRALVVMSPPEQPPGTRQVLPLAILRRFPFASSLQRMSVLVKPPGDALPEVYMKGAPEIVAGLCTSESVPTDLSQALCRFTRDGFRVLGLAYKPVVAIGTFEEVQDVSRDSVESQMCFLGLLVLKNVLKAETTPVIHSLRSAEIRTVMATGDNMLTAISVARNCHMVEAKEPVVFVNAAPPDHGSPATLRFTPAEQATEPAEGSYQLESYFPEQHACHLAMDGKSFAVVCEHFPDVLPKILVRTTILARMLPEQKALLVQKLQELNYCVLMCGDGANDCGALKAADVGISLSEAEASVASPFTSRTANVECVPAVIREGRCSLVTSFGIFKYMALYSLVQFVSVLLLYTINTNLSDSQFLFFDLAITSTVAALMGRTAPATGLGPARPRGTLISVPVLGSLLLQTGLLIAVQVGSYLIATSQQWFVPLNSTVTAPRNIPNYENTVVFCITGFQYLTLAVAMSKGDPFRKPLYTNVVFLIALIVLFGLMIWLTLHPLNFMKKLLKLKGIDDLEFKAGLLGMATIHFFMAFVLEILLEHGLLGCLRKWRRRTSSKKRYKMLERELREQQPTWPLMHEPLFAPSKASVATR
ncbi:polyamine-transporting ATPase 13A2 isoform X6 [Varanus komodoensis]|uniref:polyamine-transporting ATPase 13A2 isoform X6 n=1 Tax=Varanus komodoensis TaxID=61221 RepID=UPI001CF777B2|nr:polyamine-transporting ATPase 13A2 isoform X6 [Varanus komodoensis]